MLDRFHMHKYIIGATSHLLDSVEDARSDIYRAIYKKKKYKAEVCRQDEFQTARLEPDWSR